MNKTLKQQHEAFIARIKATGAKTLTYTAPCCGKSIEDRAAPKGDVWDTLAMCPHCGEKYMKVSTSTVITATLVELN
ncbi:MAG: hypothetical protein K2X63_00140 [Burkholderiaceae bacterium]|nr:hypothetical protein [Burkholderiaceae bacterium]